MPGKYDDIVDKAKRENPVAQMAVKHMEHRTSAMRRDQKAIAAKLEEAHNTGAYDEMSGAKLQKKVVTYVDTELEIIKLFDIARKEPGQPELPFQVSCHKMGFILQKIKAEFEQDEDGNAAFHALAQGEFDPDPSFYVKYPILRTDSYWGSNQGTLESAKMLCFRFSMTPETIATYAQTSIVHITPSNNLPVSFQDSGSKFFASMGVQGKLTPGFGFVHGGYSFGGQRGELKQFAFGPEDCSSIVHNWLDASVHSLSYRPAALSQCSTVDEMYAWRAMQKRGLYFTDRSKEAKQWKAYFKEMIECSVSGKKVKPGDIHLFRNFITDKGAPNTQTGASGHTTVVLGDDPDNRENVLVAECSRDMEAENRQNGVFGCAGVGIGSYPKGAERQLASNKVQQTMFLRPRTR